LDNANNSEDHCEAGRGSPLTEIVVFGNRPGCISLMQVLNLDHVVCPLVGVHTSLKKGTDSQAVPKECSYLAVLKDDSITVSAGSFYFLSF